MGQRYIHAQVTSAGDKGKETERPTGAHAQVGEHLTVLVADDDATFRRDVAKALEAEGFSVVDRVGDAAAAIVGVARLNPDICLIELELPGGGLNAIVRMAKRSPKTLIVVLSNSSRPDDVVAALTRGASGYLLKGLGDDQLASTLRAAHRGESAVSRSLVPYLVDEIRRVSDRRLTLPSGEVVLTPREWDVAELLREGNSTGEIAHQLGISPVTVRRHLGLLLRKLGAEDREAALEIIRTYVRH